MDLRQFLLYLRRIMLYGDVEKDEYEQISSDISETNRITLLVFSAIAALFLAVMTVTSFMVPSLSGNRLTYLLCFALMLAVCLLSVTCARGRKRFTSVLMYTFISILLGFGIIIGTMGNIHEITATYIALVLTIPLLFTDQPYRMWIQIYASTAVFIVTALHLKDPVTWATDIVNSLIFSTLSVLACTRMMVIKVQRHALIRKVRHMAEVDLLTGLKNRNSYEQWLNRAVRPKPDTVFCVYIDINGLHTLNNTQGHEAGDRMLQFIATALQSIFGAGDTYRVGGDEYIAYGENTAPDEVRAMVNRLRETIEDAGYHAAIGYSCEPFNGIHLEALVKRAENAMYQDKEAFYQANGLERRHMPRV